ncbi:MAG: hypothetical protein D3924_00400 [Candidatus Electrothrix sp. AR4]|nr:hypothetical protein [Candidatus Electrothrix sp. AR4]
MCVFFLTSLILSLNIKADELSAEKRLNLLADQAWVLKNLGNYVEAEKIYRNLIKKKNVSIEVYFEYLNLLLSNQRVHEAELLLNTLSFRLDENTPLAQQQRFSLIKAEVLKEKGEYSRAAESLPQKQKGQNALYIAPIYLYANDFSEAVRLLNIVKGKPEYSTEEKRRATQLLTQIKRFHSPQLQNRTRLIHNETLGTLIPIQTTLSSPLFKWGKLQFHHYALLEKHNIEVKIVHTEGLSEKSSFSLLSDGDIFGIKGKWEHSRDAWKLNVKLFYKELETDLTALLSKFSRKNGAELNVALMLSPKWRAGVMTGNSRYYFPEGYFIGEMHSVHPYAAHTIFSDSPSLQQQIGYLAVRGKGNNKYVTHQFDMGYYNLSGIYEFGMHQNTLKYSLALGYLSGKDFSGFAVTPQLELQYGLSADLDFSANIEYRTDMATGGNELRTMIGFNWRY